MEEEVKEGFSQELTQDSLSRAFMQAVGIKNSNVPNDTIKEIKNIAEGMAPWSDVLNNRTYADGHAFNPSLDRYWIAVQFFDLYKKAKSLYNNNIYEAYRKNYDISYAINWIGDECRRMEVLNKNNKTAYEERVVLFKFDKAKETMIDIIDYLQDSFSQLKTFGRYIKRTKFNGHYVAKVKYSNLITPLTDDKTLPIGQYASVSLANHQLSTDNKTSTKKYFIASNGQYTPVYFASNQSSTDDKTSTKKYFMASNEINEVKKHLDTSKDIISKTKTYGDLAKAIEDFDRMIYIPLPVTDKWIMLFVSQGFYYSLKYLIDNVKGFKIVEQKTVVTKEFPWIKHCNYEVDATNSTAELNRIVREREPFQIYGLLKFSIEQNNFNLDTFKID